MRSTTLSRFNHFFLFTFVRFLLVGIANTIVGMSVMFLLYNLCGCSYWISSVSNYLVGGMVSYFLNKYFTFRNHERSWMQVARFAATLAICFLISYSFSLAVSDFILTESSERVRGNVALFCGAVLYIALNYLGQKYLVFNSRIPAKREQTDGD